MNENKDSKDSKQGTSGTYNAKLNKFKIGNTRKSDVTISSEEIEIGTSVESVITPVKVTYKNSELIEKLGAKYSKGRPSFDLNTTAINEMHSKRRESGLEVTAEKSLFPVKPRSDSKRGSKMSITPLPPPDSAVWGKIKLENQELKVRFEGAASKSMNKIEGWYRLEPVVDPAKEGDEFGVDITNHQYAMRLRPVVADSENMELLITRKMLPQSIDLPQSGVVQISYPFMGNASSDDPGLHEVRRKILNGNKLSGSKKGRKPRGSKRGTMEEGDPGLSFDVPSELDKKFPRLSQSSKEMEEREKKTYFKDIQIIRINATSMSLRKTISKYSLFQHTISGSCILKKKWENCIQKRIRSELSKLTYYKSLQMDTRTFTQLSIGRKKPTPSSTVIRKIDCQLQSLKLSHKSNLYGGNSSSALISISTRCMNSLLSSKVKKKNIFTCTLPVNHFKNDCSKFKVCTIKQNLETYLLVEDRQKIINCNQDIVANKNYTTIKLKASGDENLNGYNSCIESSKQLLVNTINISPLNFIISNTNKVSRHFSFSTYFYSLILFLLDYEPDLLQEINKINTYHKHYSFITVKSWDISEKLELQMKNLSKTKNENKTIPKLSNKNKYHVHGSWTNPKVIEGDPLVTKIIKENKTSHGIDYKYARGGNAKCIYKRCPLKRTMSMNKKVLFQEKRKEKTKKRERKEYFREKQMKQNLRKATKMSRLKIISQKSLLKNIVELSSVIRTKSSLMTPSESKKEMSAENKRNSKIPKKTSFSTDKNISESENSNFRNSNQNTNFEKSREQKHLSSKESLKDQCAISKQKSSRINSRYFVINPTLPLENQLVSQALSTTSGINITPTPSEKIEMDGSYPKYFDNPLQINLSDNLRHSSDSRYKTKHRDRDKRKERDKNLMRGGIDSSSSVSLSNKNMPSKSNDVCPPLIKKTIVNVGKDRKKFPDKKHSRKREDKSGKVSILQRVKHCMNKKTSKVTPKTPNYDENIVSGLFCIKANSDRGVLKIELDRQSRKQLLIMLNQCPYLKQKLVKYLCEGKKKIT